MSEATSDGAPPARAPFDEVDDLPPPNNPETQADQAAGLVEPIFDHRARYETELLTAEFGPPDPDGVYGRNPGTLITFPLRRGDIEGSR
jgi:hypothetical protein